MPEKKGPIHCKFVLIENPEQLTDDLITLFSNSQFIKEIEIEEIKNIYILDDTNKNALTEIDENIKSIITINNKYTDKYTDKYTMSDDDIQRLKIGFRPKIALKKYLTNLPVDKKKPIKMIMKKPELLYPTGITELTDEYTPIILCITSLNGTDEDIIGGYAKYSIRSNGNGNGNGEFIYISLVESHPLLRGRQICPQLLTYLSKQYPHINKIKLSNVGGLPGCKCYVSAFNKIGFNYTTNLNGQNAINEDCETLETTKDEKHLEGYNMEFIRKTESSYQQYNTSKKYKHHSKNIKNNGHTIKKRKQTKINYIKNGKNGKNGKHSKHGKTGKTDKN